MSRAAALILAVAIVGCGPSAASSTPRPIGSGTLGPAPSGSATPTPLAHLSQEPVTYSPPPPATPTPSPAPGTWRWEGVVVDANGKPLEDVCIAVGPQGCQASSARTDERGVWFVDFPQAAVDFDLHFSKEGFRTFDVRITPSSDWKLDVVLRS